MPQAPSTKIIHLKKRDSVISNTNILHVSRFHESYDTGTINPPVIGGAILLEDGFVLLLEDGGQILLEDA